MEISNEEKTQFWQGIKPCRHMMSGMCKKIKTKSCQFSHVMPQNCGEHNPSLTGGKRCQKAGCTLRHPRLCFHHLRGGCFFGEKCWLYHSQHTHREDMKRVNDQQVNSLIYKIEQINGELDNLRSEFRQWKAELSEDPYNKKPPDPALSVNVDKPAYVVCAIDTLSDMWTDEEDELFKLYPEDFPCSSVKASHPSLDEDALSVNVDKPAAVVYVVDDTDTDGEDEDFLWHSDTEAEENAEHERGYGGDAVKEPGMDRGTEESLSPQERYDAIMCVVNKNQNLSDTERYDAQKEAASDLYTKQALAYREEVKKKNVVGRSECLERGCGCVRVLCPKCNLFPRSECLERGCGCVRGREDNLDRLWVCKELKKKA